MEFKKVESSHIDSIGYEKEDLVVKFTSGTKYKYSKVPTKVYESLMNAESKGKYINANIKNNYKYEKLGD